MNTVAPETYTCSVCGHAFETEDQPICCPKCNVHGGARNFPSRKTLPLARQNDQFRMGLIRGGCLLPGTVVVTQGIRARGRDFETAACLAVATDTAFTEDNDPYGDHGFGVIEVNGEKLFWKIDLYDRALEYGSDDPTDPAKTHRVLTILLPSEY